MILEGTILIFNTRDNDGYVFTEETKLSHPEKIPVAWNFEFDNPSLIVGTAEVHVSGSCLVATITTNNPMFEQLMMDPKLVYCGGILCVVKNINLILEIRSSTMLCYGVLV